MGSYQFIFIKFQMGVKLSIKKRYSICMNEEDHRRITKHAKRIKARSFSDYLVKVSMDDMKRRKVDKDWK